MRLAREWAFALVAVLVLSACDRAPREVYVPVSEPEVELRVRASALEVSVGEPVVLYAERWNRGDWKRIERRELDDGQCWLRRPPAHHEEEVADNLRWEAIPSRGVRFNTNDRSDHARSVVFEEPGRYLLRSSSGIWCSLESVANGKPLEILVRNNDR